VETENKEKIEELNQKIEEVKSSISYNNNVPEVESNIPTIPSDLNTEWEKVKENASREIPTIPFDLNEDWEKVKENANKVIVVPIIPPDLNNVWETVKANANKVPEIKSTIPTIPSDLNEEWETIKENASREIPTIPFDLNEEWDVVATLPIDAPDVFIYNDLLYTLADQHVDNITDCVYEIMPEDLGYRLEQLEKLRHTTTANEIIFHKPGDTITNNYSAHQLILPFNEDFTECICHLWKEIVCSCWGQRNNHY
jgi:hypothetical protein